jgi:hypothetical protein
MILLIIEYNLFSVFNTKIAFVIYYQENVW